MAKNIVANKYKPENLSLRFITLPLRRILGIMTVPTISLNNHKVKTN